MLDIIITILSIIFICLLWIMLYDSNRFVTEFHTFSDTRICADCRAVALTDLHNKRYGKENERLIASIRELKPDLILVTGDIPTAKPGKSLDTAIHLMQELAKDYPVYYANGNHEQRMKLYPERYGAMCEVYDKTLHEMGVHRLENAYTVLEQYGIAVYGVEIDKYYYKRFGIRPMNSEYLPSVLGQPEQDFYNILLAHNPDYFPQYADWGADMVLSGHVHGGMVRVPFWKKGVVSPNVRLFPKYDSGIFKQGKSVMWIGRGLGMHTIPIRLFNPAELMVLELKHEVQETKSNG